MLTTLQLDLLLDISESGASMVVAAPDQVEFAVQILRNHGYVEGPEDGVYFNLKLTDRGRDMVRAVKYGVRAAVFALGVPEDQRDHINWTRLTDHALAAPPTLAPVSDAIRLDTSFGRLRKLLGEED